MTSTNPTVLQPRPYRRPTARALTDTIWQHRYLHDLDVPTAREIIVRFDQLDHPAGRELSSAVHHVRRRSTPGFARTLIANAVVPAYLAALWLAGTAYLLGNSGWPHWSALDGVSWSGAAPAALASALAVGLYLGLAKLFARRVDIAVRAHADTLLSIAESRTINQPSIHE